MSEKASPVGAGITAGSNILTGILEARQKKKQRESEAEMNRQKLLTEIMSDSTKMQSEATGNRQINMQNALSHLMR